jgi:hypothetical protein
MMMDGVAPEATDPEVVISHESARRSPFSNERASSILGMGFV